MLRLNQGWRFGPYRPGAELPSFDDSRFEQVTLPHTVVPLSWRHWRPADWHRLWVYRRRLGPTRARTFLDFAGVMVNATVHRDGVPYPTHHGGYLPFSVELAPNDAESVLAVVVDSRWSAVPPQGSPDGPVSVDYLEPGGIYRDVTLREVPDVFVADVFARPVDVLRPDRRVEVQVTLDAAVAGAGRVDVALTDGSRVIAAATTPVRVTGGRSTVELTLTGLAGSTLWGPGSPQLYGVVTTLDLAGTRHTHRTRIGFREARFTPDGFLLNGSPCRVFGLNRHQSYPYVGFAMPERVQRRDAAILVEQLNCTMVRCSHYPQSPHFLDACDELGLMVWEEPAGWQYVGDAAWQEHVVANVRDMVLRDRNRPSVVLWGIRLNETADQPELYARTRRLADELDGSRQTTGAVVTQAADRSATDVFAFDDYRTDADGNATLLPPLTGVPYLVSEAVGALTGPPYYRWTDTAGVLATQLVMHARVHDIARSDDRYAGLLGWAGFDYASLNGRVHQHVKWPGVVDMFRVPKPGAAFYQSQVDPAVRVVIEPAFFWPCTGPVVIGTNCERLELTVDGRPAGTARPDRDRFPHLAHPPVFTDLPPGDELRIDGYAGGRLVGSRTFTRDVRLLLAADDPVIAADGSDATRVLFRAVDAHGNHRAGVTGKIRFDLAGPGVLVGDNPFAFGDYGGVGAVWLKASAPGRLVLTARHRRLGSATVEVVAE
ncbi:MAG TPA: glycoside hydrolase family 2 TIM barrel-domain containing protein [Pseudonocardiaceae bacterium]|nr:glycoside hydrolase family 2 TIM barrel-domain containing protein [Pseudonocardiaceae bacterium]